jgi:hypothetical protein
MKPKKRSAKEARRRAKVARTESKEINAISRERKREIAKKYIRDPRVYRLGRARDRIASIDEGFLRFCPQGASDALRTPRT